MRCGDILKPSCGLLTGGYFRKGAPGTLSEIFNLLRNDVSLCISESWACRHYHNGCLDFQAEGDENVYPMGSDTPITDLMRLNVYPQLFYSHWPLFKIKMIRSIRKDNNEKLIMFRIKNGQCEDMQ